MRVCAIVACALLVGATGKREFVALSKLAALKQLATRAHTQGGSALLNKLTTLLEKAQDDPDESAMEAFQSAVFTLAEEIGPIKTIVENGHASTQSEITTRVEAVQSAAIVVQQQKEVADGVDGLYHGCVAQEMQDRIDVETKQAEHDDAVIAQVQPCKDMEDAKVFSASVTLEAFTCDIEAQDGNCDTTQYASQSQGKVSSVNSNLADRRADYVKKKGLCEAANLAIETASANLIRAKDKWSEQRHTCQEQFGDREVQLCNFGARLKYKCQIVDDYNTLVEEIDASGTEWSHSDRESEYAALQIVECLMSTIGDHKDLDLFADSLAACEQNVSSIGTLDLKDSLYTTYVSDPYYACPEHSINIVFNGGKHWVIPPATSPEPSSDEYEEIFSHVEPIVTRESFSFCRA